MCDKLVTTAQCTAILEALPALVLAVQTVLHVAAWVLLSLMSHYHQCDCCYANGHRSVYVTDN